MAGTELGAGNSLRNREGSKGKNWNQGIKTLPLTLSRAFQQQISIEPLITKIDVLLFCSFLNKIVILSSCTASNLSVFPF